VGESAAGWRPAQDALSKSFDVVVIDLQGFGDAPALPQEVVPAAAAISDDPTLIAKLIVDFAAAERPLAA